MVENFLKETSYLGPGQAFSLICSQCGFEYIHPIGVRVQRENDVTEVTSEHIKVYKEENPARGVRIFIEYVCENGHHGVIIFEFHKGMTLVQHKVLEEVDEFPKTIWRD